jgi:hypothetical protein
MLHTVSFRRNHMFHLALVTSILLGATAGHAAAQAVAADGATGRTAVVRTVDAAAAPAATPLLTAALAQVQRPPAPPPPPPPPPSLTLSARRRGSMVGYLEDPIVGSRVRVRFDSALHAHAPDRAEFFYAKCGCYRDLPPDNPAHDPDAPGPGPGVVDDLNFRQLYVQAEYAAGARFSVFGELPLRWIQPQTPETFGNQGGIGDITAGVKLALADTPSALVTGQVKMFLPTGDAGKGLGTDHASIEPGILYYQALSERAAIESQLSLWLPFGGSNGVPTSSSDTFAGNVLTYGIGPSFDVYHQGQVRVAPVIELVGWHVLSGFQTADPADASGTNIVNLKFGARAAWGGGNSIYAGYGRALTEADWYNDILRVEYRLTF